jgi:hypothetical protein
MELRQTAWSAPGGALIVDRGAIRRPLGMAADGLLKGLPKW